MDYNRKYNSFLESLEREISPEEERESQTLYEEWRNNGKLSDLELAMFMSDKLDNITKIMEKSDKLRSRDGKISRIERTTITESSDNAEWREEINGIKDELKELKELLINKLK